MAFAPSTLSSRPRGVTCAEIGIIAKIAAANSRPMTDQAFMTVSSLRCFAVGDPNIKGTTRRVGQDRVNFENQIGLMPPSWDVGLPPPMIFQVAKGVYPVG